MNTKNNIHVLSRAVIIDHGYILLCKTCDLPVNFYFLPGGHVEHGESAAQALMRELKEELGEEAGFACVLKRFLGCLEYSFEPGHNSICHNHEYNFVFEVESGTLKKDSNIQQIEPHIQLVWIALDQLSNIDLRAEPLQGLIMQWLELPPSKSFESAMKESE